MATFRITGDDGQNGTGAGKRRMRHVALPGTYLPYRLLFSPDAGTVPKAWPRQLTVTGTVFGIDYVGAPAGSYSDTVRIVVEP